MKAINIDGGVKEVWSNAEVGAKWNTPVLTGRISLWIYRSEKNILLKCFNRSNRLDGQYREQ